MIKFGKWIAKHKVIIVIISMLLLIPSFLGMAATRVNYDILSYLPESLETVEGQDIMVDEFGMGAFSMVVVEDMDLKDVAALKQKFQDVEHVKDVLWYDSVADLSIPVSMIPDKFKDSFFNGDATMMIALFDNTTSSDAAMEAVTDMRKIANEQCFISGMSGVVTDIKNIALEEMPIYVVIAACLSLLVLLLATVGNLAGISLGILIASVFRVSEGAKTGITIAVTMFLSVLSGMMGVTLKYVIDKNAPIVNLVNPNNLITDGFYSLYYYNTLDRYFRDVCYLLVFVAICLIISFVSLRREKYDSI